MQTLGPKAPIFGKFKDNIEILSTRNLLCWKIVPSCPPTFLTNYAAGVHLYSSDNGGIYF